jgi:hypothetical protein
LAFEKKERKQSITGVSSHVSFEMGTLPVGPFTCRIRTMVQFTTAAASLYCICKKSEGGKIRKHNKIKKGGFNIIGAGEIIIMETVVVDGMPEMLLFGLVE